MIDEPTPTASELERLVIQIEQHRDAGNDQFDHLRSEFSNLETELDEFLQVTSELDKICGPIRQAATASLRPPTIDGYDELTEVGRGGMGIVYQANQVRTQRQVAIKVVHQARLVGLSDDEREQEFERFRVEPIATLDHPNIVRVYHAGNLADAPYYVMEFVAGCSLRELVQRHECTLWDLVNFFEQAARGAHHAHRHGVLHRDLKPANILIDLDSNTAKLADFGLAKLPHGRFHLDKESDSEPTVMGTLPYMSPEQLRDSDAVTVASDVYSLGASLFAALTGEPPQRDCDTQGALQTLQAHSSRVPQRLAAICAKSLAIDPDERYESAEAFADALANLLGEPGNHAAPLFSNMGWPLVLFGGFHLAAQSGLMAMLRFWPHEWAFWPLFFSMYLPLFAIFWLTKLPQRMQSHAARRELWSIWGGHLLAVGSAAFGIRWLMGDFTTSLPLIYVVLAATTGMGLLAMAANFWRGHYLLGCGWIVTALAIAAVPEWSMLIFAVAAATTSVVIGVYELHLLRDRWLDQPLISSRPATAIPFSIPSLATQLSKQPSSSSQSRIQSRPS